jgi:hypothetical protein
VASHNTEMIIGLASEFIKYLRFNHFIWNFHHLDVEKVQIQ